MSAFVLFVVLLVVVGGAAWIYYHHTALASSTTTFAPSGQTTFAPTTSFAPTTTFGTTTPAQSMVIPSGFVVDPSTGQLIAAAPPPANLLSGLPDGVTTSSVSLTNAFATKPGMAHYLGDPNLSANILSTMDWATGNTCEQACDSNSQCTHAFWVTGQLVGGGQVFPNLQCVVMKGNPWLGTAPDMATTYVKN